MEMLILGIIAGGYIGLAAHFSTIVATGTYAAIGVKKMLMGVAFSVGLMLVIIPGL